MTQRSGLPFSLSLKIWIQTNLEILGDRYMFYRKKHIRYYDAYSNIVHEETYNPRNLIKVQITRIPVY